jgi:Protein of unknown function (DUF3180).
VTLTSRRLLVAVAALGTGIGFILETVLVRLGQPVFAPPSSLGVALVLLGLGVPALAWPMRPAGTSTNKSASAPVNPFYATRVVLIAKASATTGALLAGSGLGVLLFVITRVIVVGPSALAAGVVVVGGAVLVTGSLLAEKWCHRPPIDSDRESEGEETKR